MVLNVDAMALWKLLTYLLTMVCVKDVARQHNTVRRAQKRREEKGREREKE